MKLRKLLASLALMALLGTLVPGSALAVDRHLFAEASEVGSQDGWSNKVSAHCFEDRVGDSKY